MKKLAMFAAGVLFGTAGIKLLSSKDAKKAYTHTTAAVLRAKDSVMKTVTTARENVEDNCSWQRFATIASTPTKELRLCQSPIQLNSKSKPSAVMKRASQSKR